jgi:acyl carrier protein
MENGGVPGYPRNWKRTVSGKFMRDEKEIFGIVRKIVAGKAELNEEKICLESDFRNDLHISSIVIVSIVLAVETEFDIEVSDEEIVNLMTVGDAVRFIASKVNRA